jgi:hypothetical protein
LFDPRFEDMFWYSYRLDVTTDHPELRQKMQTTEFWRRAESEGLVWRSREFGDIAEIAFPGWDPFPEPGRLVMRGLYLDVGEPAPWDQLVLWLRRRWCSRQAIVSPNR